MDFVPDMMGTGQLGPAAGAFVEEAEIVPTLGVATPRKARRLSAAHEKLFRMANIDPKATPERTYFVTDDHQLRYGIVKDDKPVFYRIDEATKAGKEQADVQGELDHSFFVVLGVREEDVGVTKRHYAMLLDGAVVFSKVEKNVVKFYDASEEEAELVRQVAAKAAETPAYGSSTTLLLYSHTPI